MNANSLDILVNLLETIQETVDDYTMYDESVPQVLYTAIDYIEEILTNEDYR